MKWPYGKLSENPIEISESTRLRIAIQDLTQEDFDKKWQQFSPEQEPVFGIMWGERHRATFEGCTTPA